MEDPEGRQRVPVPVAGRGSRPQASHAAVSDLSSGRSCVGRSMVNTVVHDVLAVVLIPWFSPRLRRLMVRRPASPPRVAHVDLTMHLRRGRRGVIRVAHLPIPALSGSQPDTAVVAGPMADWGVLLRRM